MTCLCEDETLAGTEIERDPAGALRAIVAGRAVVGTEVEVRRGGAVGRGGQLQRAAAGYVGAARRAVLVHVEIEGALALDHRASAKDQTAAVGIDIAGKCLVRAALQAAATDRDGGAGENVGGCQRQRAGAGLAEGAGDAASVEGIAAVAGDIGGCGQDSASRHGDGFARGSHKHRRVPVGKVHTTEPVGVGGVPVIVGVRVVPGFGRRAETAREERQKKEKSWFHKLGVIKWFARTVNASRLTHNDKSVT